MFFDGIEVKNCPDYANECKYIVARYDDDADEYWYWGAWNDLKEANRVSRELEGGCVFTNTDI